MKKVEIRNTIEKFVSKIEGDARIPLPPARELAEKFGASLSTVYRTLVELAEENRLQHGSNGRFYPLNKEREGGKGLRFVFLLGQVSEWHYTIRDILQGITRRTSHYEKGVTMVHIKGLIEQSDVLAPSRFADETTQERFLNRFLEENGYVWDGVIFENMWDDSVIEKFRDEFRRIVIIDRKSELGFASCVYPDFEKCASLVFNHFFAKGYERILTVIPYHDQYITQASTATVEVASITGIDYGEENLIDVSDFERRKQFVESLKNESGRVGIFCPEDNHAKILLDNLQEAGVRCPEKVGLISGTGVLPSRLANMTSVVPRFSEIGEQAVDLLQISVPQCCPIGIGFRTGATT